MTRDAHNSDPFAETDAQGASEHTFLTTVLANNIHCSSCVSQIKDVLRRPSVTDVGVNIATNEIKIIHDNNVDAQTLTQILLEEAWEIHHARTTTPEGHPVHEYHAFAYDKTGFWTNWYQKAGKVLFSRTHKGEEKHIQNCQACQSKSLDGGSSRFSRDVPSHVVQDTQVPSHANNISDITEQVSPGPSKSVNKDNVPGSSLGADQAGINSRNTTAKSKWKLVVSIGGMTCASCTSAITRGLEEMDNVESVKVNLSSNSGVIQFVGDRGYANMITEAIDEKGYDVEITSLEETSPQPNSETRDLFRAKLSVGGMVCASCTNTITKQLQSLPFVEDVAVALLTNSAVVEFRQRSNLTSIGSEVEDIGFECTIDSCEPVKPADGSGSSSEREMTIRVEGMFCDQCPSRITRALELEYGSAVSILAKPTHQHPMMSIKYTPSPPNFTIRNIISAIESVNEQFKASIYHPPTIEERSRKMQKHERDRIIHRLVLSAIAAIPTFLIGVLWMDLEKKSAAHDFFMQPILGGRATRTEWALFFIATPIYFFAADVFHRRALKEIIALWRPGSKTPILRRFYRFGSMNLLISAGTTVAYFASIALLAVDASGASRSTGSPTYFDAVIFLTFFILIGRLLEALSKAKTSDAVSELAKLKPEKATLITSNSTPDSLSSSSISIEADLLEVGDHVIVPHGSSPPADGIVIAGEGKFDESSLTGESRPITKTIGDEVYIGTIAVGDPVTIKVSKTGGSSMLDQIVLVVREGMGKRAPVERYADVLTGYFVPVITAIAILTWIIWLILGVSGALNDKYIESQAGGWAFWSLDFAIAVFVTACPCGIGLAAPTALVAGIGIAAKLGILVQGGGEAFQEAPRLDAIVFDKTGTLTEGGQLNVTDHRLLCEEKEETESVWAMVHALEEQSAHPIAQAVVKFTANKPRRSIEVISINEETGRGMTGIFSVHGSDDRYEAAIGSQSHILNLNPSLVSANTTASRVLPMWQNQSKSTVIFAFRKISSPKSPSPAASTSSNPSPSPNHPWHLGALFATSDPIRPSAAPTIAALKARGIKVFMLSGDNALTASAVGATLGIPQTNIFSQVLPVEKAEKIQVLQRTLLSRRTSPRHRSAAFPRSNSDTSTANLAARSRARSRSQPSAFNPFASSSRSYSFSTEKPARAAEASRFPFVKFFSRVEFLALLRLSCKRVFGTRAKDGGAASIDPFRSEADLERGEPEERSPDSAPTNASVAFVGDGINDAPALLASSLSISLSTGASVAMSSSSCILLSPDLTLIPELLDLSNKVYRRIKINFAWALVYNVILVPVAAGVLFKVRSDGWRLGPVWASVAMAASSVSVVVSSWVLRLEGQWRWRGRIKGRGKKD